MPKIWCLCNYRSLNVSIPIKDYDVSVGLYFNAFMLFAHTQFSYTVLLSHLCCQTLHCVRIIQLHHNKLKCTKGLFETSSDTILSILHSTLLEYFATLLLFGEYMSSYIQFSVTFSKLLSPDKHVIVLLEFSRSLLHYKNVTILQNIIFSINFHILFLIIMSVRLWVILFTI